MLLGTKVTDVVEHTVWIIYIWGKANFSFDLSTNSVFLDIPNNLKSDDLLETSLTSALNVGLLFIILCVYLFL